MAAQAVMTPTALAAGRVGLKAPMPSAPLQARMPVLPRHSRKVARTVCGASSGKDDTVVEVARSIGLNPAEGVFGFKPFPELWVGRLAMMGFLTSIVEEAITGRGTLGQIGFTDLPNQTLLAVMASLAVGGSLIGLGVTLNKARTGEMPISDLRRYRSFLGLKNEAANIAAQQKAMKLNGDFLSPDNMAEIDAARSAGSPADAVLSPDNDADVKAAAAELRKGDALSMDDAQAAKAAAVAMKEREAASAPGPSLPVAASEEIRESLSAVSEDMQYAKTVEMENGRYAMLGFLAAVLVEAGTGKGIIGQLFMYAKWSGLLGPMSGF